MKPFHSMAHGAGADHLDSAPNWFAENGSGPASLLVYDGPRAPRAWLFGFCGRMVTYCHAPAPEVICA